AFFARELLGDAAVGDTFQGAGAPADVAAGLVEITSKEGKATALAFPPRPGILPKPCRRDLHACSRFHPHGGEAKGEGWGRGRGRISVPSGGGALKGIGEKFQPDLQTGTANFSIPIALPPGRNGFQPSLNLVYSSGAGRGPLGVGWSLDVPRIARKVSQGI